METLEDMDLDGNGEVDMEGQSSNDCFLNIDNNNYYYIRIKYKNFISVTTLAHFELYWRIY